MFWRVLLARGFDTQMGIEEAQQRPNQYRIQIISRNFHTQPSSELLWALWSTLNLLADSVGWDLLHQDGWRKSK